eukprot:scaffold1078_cov69-Phaeocystis_antarctica.AAC.4
MSWPVRRRSLASATLRARAQRLARSRAGRLCPPPPPAGSRASAASAPGAAPAPAHIGAPAPGSAPM